MKDERIITVDELNRLGNYLAQRPWVEANPLLVLLQEIGNRVVAPAAPATTESAKEA